MRISKSKGDTIRKGDNERVVYDCALEQHTRKVKQNYHDSIILQNYVQFYETLIANKEESFDLGSIRDLREIPPEDFMILCTEFSRLNLEYQKTHLPISTAQLQQRISGKQKLTYDDKQRKQKERKYELSMKEIKKYLSRKNPAAQKEFLKVCEAKKKELVQNITMRYEMKLDSWKQIDERLSNFKDKVHKCQETTVVKKSIVAFVGKVFSDIIEIAEESQQKLLSSKESNEFQDKASAVHLFLQQFMDLLRMYLEERVVKDIDLKQFGQVTQYLIAISQEMITRTVEILKVKRSHLTQFKTILFTEIEMLLNIIKRDEDLTDNPYARNKMVEIIDKLAIHIQELLTLLTLIFELFSNQ